MVVIPAALGSTRLPGKMLLADSGKPLVVHTCERALEARGVDRVLVATDSPEIAAAVEAAGVEVRTTSSEPRTGTDRIVEVARHLSDPYIINLQGDEPSIDPEDLDRVADALRDDRDDDIVTLAQRIRNPEEWRDPNVVKVVVSLDGRALYFSRAPIPHAKSGGPPEGGRLGRKHVGVYGFPRARLLEFATLPRSSLEVTEGLEQLRALENGWRVRVLESPGDTRSINSRGDYDRFVAVRCAGGGPCTGAATRDANRGRIRHRDEGEA